MTDAYQTPSTRTREGDCQMRPPPKKPCATGSSFPFHDSRINRRELPGEEEKNTSTLSPSRASAG